ncbi:unnamed protein product, partial [Ixodes hexagonus]
FPPQVQLLILYKKLKYECAGSFITQRHILTAAHCVRYRDGEPTMIEIMYGSADLTRGTEMKVKGYYRHKDYVAKRSGDIAILLLPEPVPITPESKAICLPEKPPNIVGKVMSVAGWGTTKKGRNAKSGSSELMSTTQTVLAPEKCKSIFPGYNARTHICALGGWTGPCSGDSGGPLMTATGLNFEVVGIVSYGWECENYPGPYVYSNVWHFLPWIKKALRSDGDYKMLE